MDAHTVLAGGHQCRVGNCGSRDSWQWHFAETIREGNSSQILALSKSLYAVGEVTSGLHGANRLVGNSLMETVMFGRRAGEAAATYSHELDVQMRSRRALRETNEVWTTLSMLVQNWHAHCNGQFVIRCGSTAESCGTVSG
jgi:succinate dehydrogenase/fumarate reductase flavoprotein subunit